MKKITMFLSVLGISISSVVMAADWPPAFQTVFLDNCNGSQTARSPYCTCALEETMRRYSVEDMSTLQMTAQEEQAYIDALLKACGHLIN